MPKIQIVLNDAEIADLQNDIGNILVCTSTDYTFKLLVIFVQNYSYEHNFLNSSSLLALHFHAKAIFKIFPNQIVGHFQNSLSY